jgi:hypothetical protein
LFVVRDWMAMSVTSKWPAVVLIMALTLCLGCVGVGGVVGCLSCEQAVAVRERPEWGMLMSCRQSSPCSWEPSTCGLLFFCGGGQCVALLLLGTRACDVLVCRHNNQPDLLTVSCVCCDIRTGWWFLCPQADACLSLPGCSHEAAGPHPTHQVVGRLLQRQGGCACVVLRGALCATGSVWYGAVCMWHPVYVCVACMGWVWLTCGCVCDAPVLD